MGVALNHEDLLGCLFGVGNDDQLIALRYEYENGRRLAKKLQELTKLVAYHGSEKTSVTSPESMRLAHPNQDDEDLAAGWLDTTIRVLAWLADRNRPVGPAYEQARARFDSLGPLTTTNDKIAREVLFEADRQSGGTADVWELALKAVELLGDELGRIPLKEADLYNAVEIEASIKRLLGLDDRAPADGQTNRSTLGQGGGK